VILLAIVLEVTMAGNLPLIEVRVGDRPLWFLIDTGSPYTFLDSKAARTLGLKPSETATVRGAGGGEVKVDVVKGVTFRVGNGTFSDEVRLTDLSGIGAMIGHELDGFFGYEFLSRFVTTIDPRSRRIVLDDPKTYCYSGSGVVLPIRFGGRTNRWIYVPGTIKVPGLRAETGEFFVDSGSGDDVNHPLIRKSTGPLREVRGGRGLGAAGTAAVTGRIEWFRLGRFEVRDAQSTCCGGLEGTERQIGSGVLSRFRVTYDYARKRMIIEE
jgi:predicted aspartyl protease